MNLVRSAALAVTVALSGCSSDGPTEADEFDSASYVPVDAPAAEEMADEQTAAESDLGVEVISFETESFKASPSLVIQNEVGDQWVVVVDATATVERGEVRCAVVFYHYPSVRSEPWEPPSTGLDVDGQQFESTSACDGFVVDAGLPHPALDFADSNTVIVFEGFPVNAGASIDAFVVDGNSYDIWQ